MFVQRYLILAACAAILAAAAGRSAAAQTNSKEIMAKPAAELVEILKNPNASDVREGQGLPAAGGGRAPRTPSPRWSPCCPTKS